jgi:hypothetical protein
MMRVKNTSKNTLHVGGQMINPGEEVDLSDAVVKAHPALADYCVLSEPPQPPVEDSKPEQPKQPKKDKDK